MSHTVRFIAATPPAAPPATASAPPQALGASIRLSSMKTHRHPPSAIWLSKNEVSAARRHLRADSRDRHDGESDGNAKSKDHSGHDDRDGQVPLLDLRPLVDGREPVEHLQENRQANSHGYRTDDSPSYCGHIVCQHTPHSSPLVLSGTSTSDGRVTR